MGNLARVAVLNGTPIYAISRKEYIELMKSGKQDVSVYYMILDEKNYMFKDGILYGQVIDKGRSVKRMSERSWREVFNVKEEVVISERPTTEALKSEGAKKLEEVANATVKAVESLNGIGGEALEKVAKAGEAALAAQVANTEVVVKRTTATTNNRKKRPAGDIGK